MVLLASGILNALTHRSIKIRVYNIVKKQKTLQKGMLLGVGTRLPEIPVQLVQAIASLAEQGRSRKSVLQTRSQTYSTKRNYGEIQMGRQKMIDTGHDNKLDTACTFNSNIERQYDNIVRTFCIRVLNFQKIWDGRSSFTGMARHCIKRTAQDVHPRNSVLHNARLEPRKFEKLEINKVHSMNGIGPAE